MLMVTARALNAGWVTNDFEEAEETMAWMFKPVGTGITTPSLSGVRGKERNYS
jgi:hypothetical protein